MPTGSTTPTVGAPTVTASLFQGAGSKLGSGVGVFDKLVAVAFGVLAML